MASDANGAIQTVMDAIAKMPKDQQTGILKDLFGLEHVGQAEKLANNMGELRRQIELTQSAAAKGSMDREVKARLDTQMAKWEMLKNKATNAMAKIGAAPQFGTLIDKLGNLAEKIGNFAERHPKLVATVLTGAAAMGTLAVGVGVAQLAFARLLGPVAWAFKAFSWLRKGDGTISGIVKIGNALSKIKDFALNATPVLSKLGGVLSSGLLRALPTIKATGSVLFKIFGGPIYQKIFSLMGSGLIRMSVAIVRIGSSLGKVVAIAARFSGITKIFNLFGWILGKAAGLSLRFGMSLLRLLPIIKTIGVAMMTNPIFLAAGLLIGASVLIWKNWDKLKAKFMSFPAPVRGALYLIAAPITMLMIAGRKLMEQWDKFAPRARTAWNGVKQAISEKIDAIKTRLASWREKLYSLLDELGLGALKRMIQAGGHIVDGLLHGLSNKWGQLTNWLSDKAAGLARTVENALGIKSPSRVFMAIGGHTMDGLHVGLEQRFGRVRDFMTRATQSLIPTVHRPAFAEIGMGQGTQPSMRRSEFATVRQTSAREFRFEMGDIHIHTTSGDPNEIARAVRREIEQVIREAARRERSAMTDKDY